MNPGADNPKRNRLARWLVPAALAVCGLGWAMAARGDSWFAAALRNGLMIRCGVIFAAGLLILQGCAAAMVQLGRARRRRREHLSGQAGVAILEFCIVLPVAMTIVLIMVQASLLMFGNMFVHSAAYSAARSAIVQIPQDLIPDEPRNHVTFDGPSYKTRRIEDAAVMTLLPICGTPSFIEAEYAEGTLLVSGVERAIDQWGQSRPRWVRALLARKLSYAQQYTQVELLEPVGDDFGPNEDVRVIVRHQFYMSVPYTRLMFGGEEFDDQPGYFYVPMSAHCTLVNQGRNDEIEIEMIPGTNTPLLPL